MKKITLALFAFCLALGLRAQQVYDITGIKKVYANDIRAITENNEVKGYYAFYFLDKANKKENLYNLVILDNNLKQTHSVELKKSNKLRLLESSYNGDHFCFSFVDIKKKTVEYLVLDNAGKEVGTYTIKVSKPELRTYIGMLQTDDDNYSGGLMAIKGKGFVRFGMEKKDGFRIEMEMIDNSAKKVWGANSGINTDKSYESAVPYYTDENYVIIGLNSREKKLSVKSMKSSLMFLNAATGTELFKLNTTTDKYVLAAGGASFNADSKTFYVYGQFYSPEDNIMKDDSRGMFIQEVSLQGKILKESYNTWAGDINNIMLKKVNKDKYASNMKVFIHKIVKTADGKTFVIGEQYRKAVSAAGVALKALAVASGSGGGSSVMKMELHDMLVYEFDNNFSIKDVYIFEKEKTNIELPSGMGMIDANLLSFYMKIFGWFDYSYTSVTSDRKQFNSAYINYDKTIKKSEGSKYVIGNISYTKNQKLVVDHINLKSKPTAFWVLQARPGYVAIFEYFKKEKKASLRLEKLNI